MILQLFETPEWQYSHVTILHQLIREKKSCQNDFPWIRFPPPYPNVTKKKHSARPFGNGSNHSCLNGRKTTWHFPCVWVRTEQKKRFFRGTGLMGPHLRDLGVQHLEGVDLSSKMLQVGWWIWWDGWIGWIGWNVTPLLYVVFFPPRGFQTPNVSRYLEDKGFWLLCQKKIVGWLDVPDADSEDERTLMFLGVGSS